MNFDREAKTGETSEGSHDQTNPTGRQTTSDAINAIHSVSAQLQDNFIDTSSSVPSLFKEFATKIRSSLKSQSNLSLLLVTIFALIFFMQVCTLNKKFRFMPSFALWISQWSYVKNLRLVALIYLVPKLNCCNYWHQGAIITVQVIVHLCWFPSFWKPNFIRAPHFSDDKRKKKWRI